MKRSSPIQGSSDIGGGGRGGIIKTRKSTQTNNIILAHVLQSAMTLMVGFSNTCLNYNKLVI
jgi:hypothetical protein